jgi:hypothetical protein
MLEIFQAAEALPIRFEQLFGPCGALMFLLGTLMFLLGTLMFLLGPLTRCWDNNAVCRQPS